MSLKPYIVAATIASGTIGGSQASEVFHPGVIKHNDVRISDVCQQFSSKTGILVDGKESCEYSTDNGLNWYAIGGASILGLIGVGAIFRSRRKKEQTSEVHDIETTTINTTSNSFAGIEGEESGEQGEEDDILMNSSGIDDNGPNEETATEDPIESATVYISYGRYDQAEEILLEELQKNPENLGAYKKLLGIFHHAKNVRRFEEVFMHDALAHFRKGISEEDMDEIRSWGQEIDPENPIYIHPIPSGEITSTEIKIQNEGNDPNKIIDTLFRKGKWRTGLDSLELRDVSNALKSENISPENIMNGSLMIIKSYHASTNPEHKKIVISCLDTISEFYIKKGQYDTLAQYLLEELSISKSKEKILELLLSVSLHIADKEIFGKTYLSFPKFPGFIISDDDKNSLRNHGKMIDPDNQLYQEPSKDQKKNTITAQGPIVKEAPEVVPPSNASSNKPEKTGNKTPGIQDTVSIQLGKRGFSIKKDEENERIVITVTREGSGLSVLDNNGDIIEKIGFGQEYIVDTTYANLYLGQKYNSLCIRMEDRKGKSVYVKIIGKVLP